MSFHDPYGLDDLMRGDGPGGRGPAAPRRFNRRALIGWALLLGLVAWIVVASNHTGGTPPPAVRAPSKYVVPDPAAVVHRAGYDIRPCPTDVPAAGSSWFAPRAFEINSVSAQAGYRATRLVDAGPIDLSDGALWVDGAESLPAPEGSWYAVKAGTPHVTLLIADTHRGGGSVVAAVEIRLGEGRPVRWEQKPELAGGTDGGTMGVAGLAAARSLAAHRTFDQAVKELDTPNFWVTPCRRFFTLPAAQAAPAMALEITLTGDGGWPGAVGYDVDGHPVDVLISTTVLPWSDLGMPGTPPPQAVADEPTPSAS